MSFFSAEMQPLVEVFQRETADLIKELEQALEHTAQQGTLDSETINGIFRVAHTIKSSAAMMGLDTLSRGTHRLEELFLRFREDPSLCRGKEKQLLALLYDYEDTVRDEAEKMSDADYAPAHLEKLIEEIEQGIARFAAPQATEKPLAQAPEKAPAQTSEATLAGQPCDLVFQVKFKESCPLVGVRAALLLKQIRPVCSALKWKPEDLKAEDIAGQLKADGLQVYAVTRQPGSVMKRFESSPYVLAVLQAKEQVAAGPKDGKPGNEAAPTKQTEDPQNAAEQGNDLKTSRFCTLPWEKIMRLQRITEDLIVSQTLLENMVAEMGKPRGLEAFAQSLGRTLGDLKRVTDDVSLTPVSSVKTQLNRIVRDICKKENKEVDFTIEGEEIEADKNLIDTMLNPLMHLIRNAIDHGIEPVDERRALGKQASGQVKLAVSSNGSMLLFRVTDDGSGIDTEEVLAKAEQKQLLSKARTAYTRDEALSLITLPGFSTTKTANEFSGRGVGMDVVRSSVEALGGALVVKSEKGKGTTFDMQVPVSMTAVDSMCFKVGETTCLLPMMSIRHIYALDEIADRLYFVDGQEMLREDSMIPVLRMAAVFGVPREAWGEEYLLVLRGIKSDLCIVTGAITGQQTAVNKKLPSIFRQEYGGTTGISGAVVIGDGALGMMLNTEKLIEVHRKGQSS